MSVKNPLNLQNLDLSELTAVFEKQKQAKRIYTFTELKSLFQENQIPTQQQLSSPSSPIIKELLKKTKLRVYQLSFPSKKQTRFTWGEMPIHQILLSLNSTKAYFSHLTALHIHQLSDKNLKTIYVNCEQSPKPKSDEPLEQSAIDQAFARPPRISRNSIRIRGHTVYLLNGMNTDGLGVKTVELPEIGLVRTTNIERTLIDIVVRPRYSGGISGVLNAFRKSRHLASVKTISQMLKELDYVYPYHQAIGFYLDACGFQETAVLKKFGLNHKFYLDHQISDPDFSNEWQVFFPRHLKLSPRR